MFSVGDAALTDLGNLLATSRYEGVLKFVLVDENSKELCLPKLLLAVPELNGAEILEIESGEEHKDLDTCQGLWRALIELNARRNSILINLGGGVITDLGGFVATVFKRGIPFINVPTTLLGQVDAAIGGKVGVNFDSLKNQLGQFSMPEGVLVYPDFLKTLDERQVRSGFAEVVKHALIGDAVIWTELTKIEPELSQILPFVRRAVAIKQEITDKDPLEIGLRKILNFGHTSGHAMESVALEQSLDLLHGEAVAAGMCVELYLSRKLGLGTKDSDQIAQRIVSWFGKLAWVDQNRDAIAAKMWQDKKSRGTELNFTLLSQIGIAEYNVVASEEEVMDALTYYSNL